MMSKMRMSAHLDLNDPDERDFITYWQSVVPRRRQQWLREQAYLGNAVGATVLSRGPTDGSATPRTPEFIRVQVDLNDTDENDSAVYNQYMQQSKARRGYWLKNILLLGHRVWRGDATPLAQLGPFFLRQGGVQNLPEPLVPAAVRVVPRSTPQVVEDSLGIDSSITRPPNKTVVRNLPPEQVEQPRVDPAPQTSVEKQVADDNRGDIAATDSTDTSTPDPVTPSFGRASDLRGLFGLT
jgi:hypothetical protein